MKSFLIIGLGNKGDEYIETRHNIGFKVIEAFADALGDSFSSDSFGWMCRSSYKGRKVYILKPDTYMNLSGKAIKHWISKLNINIEHMLVITDDLNLPFGTIRVKEKGSNGGHNGLKSIETEINSLNYPRLRFGIGAEYSKGQQIDYVLGKWNEEELSSLQERINVCVSAIQSFIFGGVKQAMNNYNGK